MEAFELDIDNNSNSNSDSDKQPVADIQTMIVQRMQNLNKRKTEVNTIKNFIPKLEEIQDVSNYSSIGVPEVQQKKEENSIHKLNSLELAIDSDSDSNTKQLIHNNSAKVKIPINKIPTEIFDIESDSNSEKDKKQPTSISQVLTNEKIKSIKTPKNAKFEGNTIPTPTFDFDVISVSEKDEDSPKPNKSTLATQRIQIVNSNKFGANTITKGFFSASQDDEYQVGESPSKASQKQKEEDLKFRNKTLKNDSVKLQPFGQQKNVQVFENLNRKGHKEQDGIDSQYLQELQQIQDYDFEKKLEEVVSPTTPQTIDEQGEIASIQREKSLQLSLTLSPLKKQTQIPQVFTPQSQHGLPKIDDADEDEQEKQGEEKEKVIDEEASGIKVVGSQYFNFSSRQDIIKQLMVQIKVGSLLRMELVRDDSGFNTFWPQFYLQFSRNTNFLISAKKTSSQPTSTFILSSNKDNFEENSPYYMGKMQSNLLGNILNIFGPGLCLSEAREKNTAPRQLLATIVYERNLFQVNKPRAFTLFIKNLSAKYYSSFPEVKQYEKEVPLSILYQNLENRQNIKAYVNRKPKWIQKQDGFMMDFKGRVKIPSVKNFIIEETLEGTEMVIFGKVSDSTFNLDMRKPISPMIAFCAALSSFDSRFLCE